MPAGTHSSEHPRQLPTVQVYTLGTFRVLVGGQAVQEHAWRRRTARQLFKVLLTRPGRRMTRDEVVELFWPDSDAEAAASNLRSTLYALRRALQPSQLAHPSDVIFGDHSSLWLGPDPDLWMDAVAFEHTVAEAWRSPDPLPLLEQASALYAGDFLPDDLYEDWAGERRDALKRTWTELQFGLAQALEARSDVNAALQPLERLLRADPCDERAAQEQMKLLTRYGRRAEALRVYQRLAQSLREELDVDPSAESLELQRQISAGESVASPPVPAATFRCSYPFPVPVELVGRESELSALSLVLASARTAGRVAVVSAPAGTGKSSLVGQLVREAQAQGVLCLVGGCYEERGAVPLGPFHDALVDFLLAQPGDRIRALLGSALEDLAQLIPELRYHLQLPQPQGPALVDRTRAFSAIHACLRSLAERGPVLMCLEDLHAADAASLQLLHYLARQTRRLPLLLVATYRDDEASADQPLAQTVAAMLRERLVQRVVLAPLNREQTDQLFANLLEGPASETLGESLYTTTGGNPLFVEQLVLGLSEGGQIQRQGGFWYETGELRGTPQIVREVIAQRLQRLDAGCRKVLDMASVLGQSFEHAVLLSAVHPLDEPSLLAHLDRAMAGHLLQDTPGGYAFCHALLREAVYWDLSGPRRMLLHAQAGEQLERSYADRAHDHAAQLAYHFSLAGDSEGVRAKALTYSLTAGQRATALSAYAEALMQFNRASDLLGRVTGQGRTEDRISALTGRGMAESHLAHYEDSIVDFRQALELSSDPIERGRARKIIAFSLAHMGALDDLLVECEAGMDEVASVSGPDANEIRATLQQLIGWTLYRRGRFAEVYQLGKEIEAEAAAAEHPARLLAHRLMGWCYMGSGQVEAAIQHYEQSVAEAELWGEKVNLAVSYETLGYEEYLGGRFADAREHIAHALTLYRESASEQLGQWSLHVLCRIWLDEGEYSRAVQQIAQALQVEIEGHEPFVHDAYLLLGMAQAARCDWAEAAANLHRAVEISVSSADQLTLILALTCLGSVEQFSGRWSDAAAHYQAAVKLARAIDPSPFRVLALRHSGHLRLLAGETSWAADELGEALSLAANMSETLEYAPTLRAKAEFHLLLGELTDATSLARQSLEHARPVAQRVEALILLARVLLEAEDGVAADGYAREAVALAESLKSPRLLALAHLALARAMPPDRLANEAFKRALECADGADAPYERAIVRLAYSKHLTEAGSAPGQARVLAEEAAALLRQLQPPLPKPVPA
jgi:DNA-binding SARP family transcriptional activator